MKPLIQIALVLSMSLCGASFAADQAHDDKHGHEGLHAVHAEIDARPTYMESIREGN